MLFSYPIRLLVFFNNLNLVSKYKYKYKDINLKKVIFYFFLLYDKVYIIIISLELATAQLYFKLRHRGWQYKLLTFQMKTMYKMNWF